MLWYSTFHNHSDEMMETAMRLVLLNSLYFPNVAEIQKAINELQQEARYDNPRQLERGQSKSEAKANLELMQKYISEYRNNNYDKDAWITELRPFAQSIFSEISDDLIWKNYCDLSHTKERVEQCQACTWSVKECLHGGLIPVLTMESNGNIHISSTGCRKRGNK